MAKFTSVSISGYNSLPPVDDGTVSEANKVKWSTEKTKLTDPLKTAIESINTNLVSAFDVGPTALTTSTTLAASHYGDFIQTSGASLTHTLTDAATLGAGWHCQIKSTDANNVTIARATGADTINGIAADVTLKGNSSCLFYVNAAANGFIFVGNAATLGSNTFTDGQNIQSTLPYLVAIESDAAADNKRWSISAQGETFYIKAENDAVTTTTEILTVQRTGTTVDSVTIGGTTVSVGGTLSSTKAAASGYSRVTPNMCRVNTKPAETSLTRDTVTEVTGPTGCKGLIILLVIAAGSNNAIASRNSEIVVYSEVGATNVLAHATAVAYEQAATGAGTILLQTRTEVHVKADANGKVWLRMTDDTGNQGLGYYAIMGYYD